MHTLKLIKFSKQEIQNADLCARALWYGIAFDTGKNQISDAELLEKFATQFYSYHTHKKPLKPPILEKEVRELIRVGRIYILYRGISGMNFQKGIKAIYGDIYARFKQITKKSFRGNKDEEGWTCLKLLSDGFCVNPNGNRLVLSSRILFFLIPDFFIVNMNNGVAKSFGLRSQAHNHYIDFYALMYRTLKANQTQLNKFKLPEDKLNELSFQTWDRVRQTDWWLRRVLDIAILIRTNNAKPVHPNLKHLINEKVSSSLKL